MRPTIRELIDRPLLRDDQALEVFNKMTDEELEAYENETLEKVKDISGIDKASARLAKDIDYEVLYQVIKEHTV